MTPEQRRNKIIKRMEALGVTVHKLILKSEYSGVRGYIEGNTDAADRHVYAMEQALNRIEKAKEVTK